MKEYVFNVTVFMIEKMGVVIEKFTRAMVVIIVIIGATKKRVDSNVIEWFAFQCTLRS